MSLQIARRMLLVALALAALAAPVLGLLVLLAAATAARRAPDQGPDTTTV